MTVVDASVVVAALLEDGPLADWSQAQLEGEYLAAPHLLPAEVHHAVRRAERRSQVDSTTATLAIREFGSLTLYLFPLVPLGDRIWELRPSLTPYDAWYVALAEALDCELVTLDGRLARSNGAKCPIVTPPDDIVRR